MGALAVVLGDCGSVSGRASISAVSGWGCHCRRDGGVATLPGRFFSCRATCDWGSLYLAGLAWEQLQALMT